MPKLMSTMMCRWPLLALLPPLSLALLFAAASSPAHADADAGAGAPASAGSARLSNASADIVDGSAQVVGGSLQALVAGGSVIIASVEVVGEASVVVLTSAVDGSRASVRLSGQAARALSGALGGAVDVVVLSTGHLLVSMGRVLAFIPNEAGRALLHSARVAERG